MAEATLPDQYDPADDRLSGARELQLSATEETHTISPDDVDWFRFDAFGGRVYSFNNSVGDPVIITLYADIDTDGELETVAIGVLGSTTGYGWWSWAPPHDTPVYAAVTGGSSVGGEYSLAASINTPGTGLGRNGYLWRVFQADRYSTAVAVAKTAFPDWTSASGGALRDVVIASGEDRAAADPLAASSLAGVYGCPVLLVNSRTVPSSVSYALKQMRNGNAGALNIHVIGGTGSVPGAVYSSLSAMKGSGRIERIGGVDRYDLAAKIADRVLAAWKRAGSKPWLVLVANGDNPASFSDALSAAPICYSSGVPLLLTKTSSVPPATTARLTAYAGTPVVVLNSSKYVTESVRLKVKATERVTRSSDKYRASADIAQFGMDTGALWTGIYGVTAKLSDSFAGGAAMGELCGPLLYTYWSTLSLAHQELLSWRSGSTVAVVIFGGYPSCYLNVEGGILSASGYLERIPQ